MLADKVYDAIRAGLLEHRITPGARMNVADLARSLHVSNTPVRQALARLHSDGLVTQEPYRGYRATALLETRMIEDLYEFRFLLEPVAAARAARLRTESDQIALSALCDEHDVAELITSPAGRVTLAERDLLLHTTIARLSGNPVIAEAVSDSVHRFMAYTLYGREDAARAAWDEHLQISTAIAERRSDDARSAMKTHLRNGMRRMRVAVDGSHDAL
ncbi:MAG: GntR family transcriptional regulator [Rhodoglobus sp.]